MTWTRSPLRELQAESPRKLPMANDPEIKTLTARIDELTRRIGLMEDTQAVRTLHFKYGYYIDKCLYDEAVDLFADDGRAHFLNGVYRGKTGVRRLYCDWFRNLFTRGHNGPTDGLLLDHLQMQDIVDVAPDGLTAKGRFRALMTGGQHATKSPASRAFLRSAGKEARTRTRTSRTKVSGRSRC